MTSTEPEETLRKLAGWSRQPDAIFERIAGQLWIHQNGAEVGYALASEPRHDNGAGAVHGGVLALLADHALGLRLRAEPGWSRQATIQLEIAYLAAARPGDFIEVKTEVLRSTRNLTFIRATLTVGPQTVASANGIWKIDRR